MGWLYVLDDPLVTLTQGHGCDIDKQKFACLQGKVKTTQPITAKLSSDIPLVMIITWLDFWGNLLETFILPNFGCVFSRSNTLGHISGVIGPINVKRKGGASVGYWANYVTLTFDLTHDIDLVVSRSNFEIALFEEWVGWLRWNKRDVSRSFMTMTVTCG